MGLSKPQCFWSDFVDYCQGVWQRGQEKLANRTLKGIGIQFSKPGPRVHAMLSTFFYD
jgi:hypothetical protein